MDNLAQPEWLLDLQYSADAPFLELVELVEQVRVKEVELKALKSKQASLEFACSKLLGEAKSKKIKDYTIYRRQDVVYAAKSDVSITVLEAQGLSYYVSKEVSQRKLNKDWESLPPFVREQFSKIIRDKIIVRKLV
jgi:hypothetical protein